jgi:serine/threonine-protein kinase
MEIFWAHVNKRPIRPMRQAPDLVSPELDQVIMKALAKSPDARFQTAGEVRHALETLARRAAESGSGVRAAPTLEVPITRARKNVVIVVGVGVAAALALVWLLRG